MKKNLFKLMFVALLGAAIGCNICSSCKNKNRTDEDIETEVIRIDFRQEYKERKFPHISYSMHIQRLEEDEKNPIGYINKLIVDNQRIYILDRDKAKAIFIYDRNGKLFRIIENKGNGPGEFVLPQDFAIDKKTGNIIIMDNRSNKFVIYSPEGNYIKEFKYDSLAFSFILDDENNIIMDNGNIPSKAGNYYLRKMDLQGNIIENYFPSNLSTVGITFTPRFALQQCEEAIYFLPSVSNCIYSIEGEKPELVYEIDFGDLWPSQEFWENAQKIHPLKIREQIFENDYVCFLNCIQTRDVLHLDFYKGKNYSFYFNKKTKQTLLISMENENISFPLTTFGDDFVFVKYDEVTGKPTIVFYNIDFQYSFN